jgi:hypothetical protein
MDKTFVFSSEINLSGFADGFADGFVKTPDSPKHDPFPSKITDNIFLGDYGGCDETFFKKNNINAVIQVMNNPPHLPDSIKCLHIDILDKGNVVITDFFPQCFTFIDEQIERGVNIYIHCAMGISRSASIVIGYIMKKNNMSFNDAYKFVKDRRPQVDPNFGFCCQLVQYEKTLNL